MFLVSGITGARSSFIPSVTPISTAVRELAPVTAVRSAPSAAQPELGADSPPPHHRALRGYAERSPERARTRVVTAADIMSSPVFALKDDFLIGEARKVFRQRKFRHIPILSPAGMLNGILSDRDLFGKTLDGSAIPGDTTIGDIMVTNILTATPDTPIREIALVLLTHHIGCLPILDTEGTLTGILTRTDILRAIVNGAPIELWS